MAELTPTQRLVYEEIKTIVRSGGMTVLPTELTLARKLGISKPIIHKVLQILTAEGAIPPVVGKRRFLPGIDGSDSGELAMIAVVNMTGSLNPVLRTSLWDRIVRSGYNPVSIEVTCRDLCRMDRITSPVLKFKGVVAATVWDAKIFRWLESFGCPVVVLDHISDSRRFIDILPDERHGCKRIVDFFHKKAVRSVAYFDYFDESWNPPRWNAFVAAANSRGIEISERVFVRGFAADPVFLEATIRKIPRGTGIFCANQATCEGVLLGMSKCKVRSPNDYPLAYVGENELFSDGNPITRYSLQWEKAAEITCQTMVELIRNPKTSLKRKFFPVKVFRGKTL